jgi:hypothetical protein
MTMKYFFRILVEYSIEEDLAILKCLLYKNLHDKVERNTTWKIVNRVSLMEK